MPDHPRHPAIALCEGGFYADDPHPLFRWMRAEAPVYWDDQGAVWGLATYDAVKQASKDTATFSSAGGIRPGMGPLPMMIDMDDPEHWHRRKLVNRGFTPKRVRDSEAKIRRVCDEIIDDVCERGTCDLVAEVAALLPMIMIGDMLGVAPSQRADLLRWSEDMLSSQSGSATEETVVAAANAFSEYCEYASAAIEARRRDAYDDLMSVLVAAEVDGDRLVDEEIIHESLLILVGGDETTRHVISEGMYQLLRAPDQLAALQAQPDAIPTAVEEMLRWVSPIKNMARTVTRDVEVEGQRLRAGDEVLLLYPSANRDEKVFDDPDRFDVFRTPNDHVAFGFGTHFCLGNSLARLEIRVMVERLLARLPDLALATDDVTFRAANFISGPEAVPVRFTPTPRLSDR